MCMHRWCLNMCIYLYVCIHVNRLICINHQRGNWDMDPETMCNCSVGDPSVSKIGILL